MTGVLVVTGGSRGIGAAIARLGGKRGYRVAVNYVQAKERAQEVVDDIRDAGSEAIAIQGDTGSEADMVRLFEQVDEAFGPVTALVNNAAIDHEIAIADFAVADLERVYAVNVTGPFVCAREAIRRMSTRLGGKGGVIINISSISARYGGLPGDVIYASSKGALDSFSLGLGKEVAKEGIRVVSVRPGLTLTDIWERSNVGREGAIELGKTGAPIGRIAEPEEVANLALWLCSDEASYVTATCYDVSGGR